MKEEWRDVVGFEGLYRVSSRGRVRSKKRWSRRETPCWKCSECGSHVLECVVGGKMLKSWPMGRGGHLYVGLYKADSVRSETKAVHRLVLEAFVGPCPEKHECCHYDGDPANNCLENLRWDTYKKNMDDRERHGRHNKGSDSVKAKLVESDIPAIRRLLKEGDISMTQIGKRYRVHAATIRDIRDGKTWGHVP